MKTKRCMMWAALWLVAVCVPATGVKLSNPSFEDPETEYDNPYGDIPAHWGRWGNWINRESGWKPTKDGKCLLGYHHWRIEEKDPSGVYQDVEGIPNGSKVTFTIYAARDKETNADAIELRLERLNGGATLASSRYSMHDLKNNWTKISVEGVAQGGGVRVLVIVTPGSQGERKGALKFDDADLAIEKPDSRQQRLEGLATRK